MIRALAGPALLLVIAAPAAGALLSWSRRSLPRSGAAARSATTLALAATVVLVAASGSAAASWSIRGRLLVEADRLGALLAVFVLAATLVIQTFALRSLAGDVERHRFFVASGLAATGTVAVVLAADLWVMVVAWAGVSLATTLLLRHDGRPAARAAAGRARASFAVGDVALALAALVGSLSVGAVTLRPDALAEMVAREPSAGPVGLVGVLAVAVVVAAMTRSAIPPLQGWLPSSVAAPTPSSALLHAGIVNGGGVLLIRFAPVLSASQLATGVAVVGGCAGVLIGGAVSRTRPDVKTGLAWSTVAQMGFMVVQCVTGLLGPALVHMVAHGMYKANLFLGSGSTLAHTHPPVVGTGSRSTRSAVGALVAATAVGTAWLVVRPSSFDGAAGVVFAAFVAVTVGQAAVAWQRARPHRSLLDLAAGAALVVATTVAVAIAAGIKTWLGPSLPDVQPALATAGAVALAATGALAVALALAARLGRGPVATGSAVAYLWASHLGDPARLVPVMRPVEVHR